MANELTPSSRAVRTTGRSVRAGDEAPQALLEFFSPSAGLIATPVRPAARSTIFIVTTLFAVFLLIAVFCPLNRVVTGAGALTAVDSTIVVQPFDQAIVHSIAVHEGDIVKPGQVLARLDPTLSEADVANLGQQVGSYAAEVARLRAEADNATYRADVADPAQTEQEAAFLQRGAEFKARMDNYARQIDGAKADLAGDRASASAFAQRLKLASDVQAMRLQLQAEAIGSRLNSLAAADSVAEMQRSEADAISNANSAQAKIAALTAERDAYRTEWRAGIYHDLTDAQRKLYETRDDLARADLRHKLVVFRASRPAVVLTIAKVSVGSVLQPGSEFITLMPVDSKLDVVARIPASQSGYVRLGDTVRVKFNTFPFLAYGGALGTVENVSADSFTQGRSGTADSSGMVGGAAVGGAAGETYYRVRIGLSRYTLHNLPRGFRPTPGMPVTTDIKVGQRTIAQYLLSSVVPTLREGMREP